MSTHQPTNHLRRFGVGRRVLPALLLFQPRRSAKVRLALFPCLLNHKKAGFVEAERRVLVLNPHQAAGALLVRRRQMDQADDLRAENERLPALSRP